MLKVYNEKHSFFVCNQGERRWVSTGRAISALCSASALTLRMSPLLKLSSSSAVALKSYLAMASILSAAQCSAAWSRGKGVFPAEATQRSGLSLASLLGLAPALWDTQCHPEAGERRLRAVARIEGNPALPIGLLSQPPRPLARPGSALLPPFQATAPPSTSSSFQPQPPGDWQACRPMAQLPELFLNTLPLPSRWVCTACRNRLESRSVSAFPPLLLTGSSPAPNTVHWKEGLTLGMAPVSSRLNRPVSLPSPPPSFLVFWECWLPYSTVKSKQSKTLWSRAAALFSKLNHDLLPGEQEKVNVGTAFSIHLLLQAPAAFPLHFHVVIGKLR